MAAAIDDWVGRTSQRNFGSAAAVTPDDNNDLTHVTRALYIGTSAPGTLTVVMQDGATVLFGALTAGSLLPIRVSRVKTTGTTVSNIVALW